MQNNDKCDEKPRQENCQLITKMQSASADQNCAEGTQGSKEIMQPEIKPKSITPWSLWFEFLLVIATCTTAGVAFFQWQAMKSQSDIMKGQLTAAQDSIEIAKKTLEDASKSGEEQSVKAERLTKANENISNAALQSAAAMVETVAQSKRSLNATIENNRLEQRAWISNKDIIPTEYTDGDKKVFLKEGQRFKVEVVQGNTGKTLARVLTTKTYVSVAKFGEKPALAENAIISTGPTPFVMFPGDAIGSGEMLTGVYSKEQIEAIKSGRYILYVYGMITYKDVFEHFHWTQYCAYLTSDLTSLSPCSFYNETDDTQKTK